MPIFKIYGWSRWKNESVWIIDLKPLADDFDIPISKIMTNGVVKNLTQFLLTDSFEVSFDPKPNKAVSGTALRHGILNLVNTQLSSNFQKLSISNNSSEIPQKMVGWTA